MPKKRAANKINRRVLGGGVGTQQVPILQRRGWPTLGRTRNLANSQKRKARRRRRINWTHFLIGLATVAVVVLSDAGLPPLSPAQLPA